MKWTLILPILFVMLSGCIASVQTGDGIVIKEFSSDFPVVYPGEEINFYLRMQNQGSFAATNVWAELLGVDQDWCCEPAGSGPWTSGGEKLPNEKECRFTTTEHFSLKPPNPFWGVPGEEKMCTWTYKIPQYGPGFQKTYEATIRVFYTYKAYFRQVIKVVSMAELQAAQAQGKPISISQVEPVRAPIKVSIDIPTPVRYSFGANSVTFPITIHISNVGGGTACLPGECKKPSTGWNKIKLSAELYPNIKMDCLSKPMVIDLYQGRGNTIQCQLKLTELKNISEERAITIIAEHGYFVDKTIQITVKSEQV
ncbi:MAG: hypothetical protein QXG26_00275 [Candidatus Aenigmatarchaeota archaeon]